MEPLAMLHADPLDLLFENRNKLYGAYPLRKYYNQRLLISLGFTFTLVMISSFLYLHNNSSSVFIPNCPILPDVILQDVNLTPEIKSSVQTQSSNVTKPPVTVIHNIPFIVEDKRVIDPVAKIDQFQGPAIGVTTSADNPGNDEPHNLNTASGTLLAKPDLIEEKPEILDRAEVMPEFPGGLEALKRFLLKNLRMPENNLEEGSRVQVIARFVVGTDGRVQEVEITHPGNAEFNAEVKRVISKMPDWKPGLQNHRTVAVYFSLPVNFVRD